MTELIPLKDFDFVRRKQINAMEASRVAHEHAFLDGGTKKDAIEASRKVRERNGLACPECGKELDDCGPDAFHQSRPMKVNVACIFCTWNGTRVK